jgi:hypothetical protein
VRFGLSDDDRLRLWGASAMESPKVVRVLLEHSGDTGDVPIAVDAALSALTRERPDLARSRELLCDAITMLDLAIGDSAGVEPAELSHERMRRAATSLRRIGMVNSLHAAVACAHEVADYLTPRPEEL